MRKAKKKDWSERSAENFVDRKKFYASKKIINRTYKDSLINKCINAENKLVKKEKHFSFSEFSERVFRESFQSL